MNTVKDTTPFTEAEKKLIAIGLMLEELAQDEGEYITILHPNPDFIGPERIIECMGEWTDWKCHRVDGNNLYECLISAVAKRLAFEETGELPS